jgi:GNAT superfamily N-acetyltransferase
MSKLGVYTTHSGEKITIRHLQENDTQLLVDMFQRLSPESTRLRFHLYTTRIPEQRVWQEAKGLTRCDECKMAIVATVRAEDGQEHAVGVAHYARKSVHDKEAEVAIVVRDDYQRKGLGKYLLKILAKQARQEGVTYFSAWILAENIRLMKLIKGMELRNVQSETRHGEQKIRVPLNEQEWGKSGCLGWIPQLFSRRQA